MPKIRLNKLLGLSAFISCRFAIAELFGAAKKQTEESEFICKPPTSTFEPPIEGPINKFPGFDAKYHLETDRLQKDADRQLHKQLTAREEQLAKTRLKQRSNQHKNIQHGPRTR